MYDCFLYEIHEREKISKCISKDANVREFLNISLFALLASRINISFIIWTISICFTWFITLLFITCNGFVKLLKAFKKIKSKHEKIEILAKIKLNSIESIISKAIQYSNISEKDYVLLIINNAENRYKFNKGTRRILKVHWAILKENDWFNMVVKVVLSNSVKIYLVYEENLLN